MKMYHKKKASGLTKKVGSLGLSLALVLSGMQSVPVNVLAADPGTWRGDVTAAMESLTQAMGAADTYAQSLQTMKTAIESLEMAITVENLRVTAVGEDYVTLQWLPVDDEKVIGYNVYWGDKNLESTKFQLLGPDGKLAERMSGDLDENGKKKEAPTMTLAAADVAGKTAIEYKVNMSTFKNNYFKVAVVTKDDVGTKTEAVMSPTAVEYEAIIDDLGRGLIATQKADGVYLSWRLTYDELDGGYFKDESGQGLTGLNFNVYRNGEKIATVSNSTNYLDKAVTSGLTQDMYTLIPVDANGQEITAEKAGIYQILTNDTANTNTAYLEFATYVPKAETLKEIYGIEEAVLNNPNTLISYSLNDASTVDVDGDGEYEILAKWYPSNAKDVSQWGYTGKSMIDCYKLDGTLLWRVDLGVNIRAGAHYTQHLAYDFEGDGQGEMILKTAPGTKIIQYELDGSGKNVMVDTDNDGVADYPKVKSEKYITLPADDVAAGVTNQDNYVMSNADYKEYLVEAFMDWGVWDKYSESTKKGIVGYWPGNLVECFSISPKWGDKSFYTYDKTSAALDVSKMSVADIQKYVPDYEEGDLLVPVAKEIPTEDTDRTAVARNAQLMTVLVEDVKDYTGGYDLEKVNKDVTGVGYTREEAEILAGYFMEHYGYTNYRHLVTTFEGFILTGPEYVTLFDAKTGAELDTQDYAIAREDDGLVWGDYGWFGGKEPGNRVDRFNSAVVYLDGETPSAVLGRGYYARTAFEAWNVVDGKLVLVDTIDSGSQIMTNPFNDSGEYVNGSDPEAGIMSGQGQHYITAVDANLDGRQEIINGGAIVSLDKNTKQLYVYNAGGDYIGGDESKGWKKFYHGDMMHITDIDPDLPGIELASCFEGGSGPWDWAVRTLYTNNVLFGKFAGSDTGRFIIGDVDGSIRGIEIASANLTASGEAVKLTANNTNHSLRWAADMTTQFLNGAEGSTANIIGQGKTYVKTTGYTTGNGTKGNPALTADLLGDYRDELLVRANDSKSMRIYLNTEVSDRKNYTPMQNLQYRAHVASQQSAYNIPSYTDYYYAADTDWQYVTIPNRKAQQKPGEVTSSEAASVASFALNRTAALNNVVAASAVAVNEWEALEDALVDLDVKLFVTPKTATTFDFDVPLVKRLMKVYDAAEAAKAVPMVDVTEGDAVYTEAEVEVTTNKATYTVSSVNNLLAAMEAYQTAKGDLDVSEELGKLQSTITYWLQGVNTDVEDVYAMYFDFNTTQTGGSKYDNSLPWEAKGWTPIGVTDKYPALTSYDANVGYGLLGPGSGRNRGGSDAMLADWVSGIALAVDLKAGDYKAAVTVGELAGTAKNQTHAIYKDYENGNGTVLAEGKVTAEKNSYITSHYEFTLEEDTQIVFTGNYVMSLAIEANAPAAVEKYDITKLEQLMTDADWAGNSAAENDYTVSSWAAYKAAYEAAQAACENAPLTTQEGEIVYTALYDAWKGLTLRAGIISYNIDFGPRVDSTKNDPQMEANGQSASDFEAKAVAGAVRPAFQLGHGDMLYSTNVTDNGLHWGFDKVVADGNTNNGGAYFRDWVYAADNGSTPYTFMADLPTGDYFVFVYTGVKEGEANTTKLIFGNEVIDTTNGATEVKGEDTVYVQKNNTGGQYPYASSTYVVRVEENPNALSDLSKVKVGTLMITAFDDENTSSRTGAINGLEIFPVRLDSISGDVDDDTVSGGDSGSDGPGTGEGEGGEGNEPGTGEGEGGEGNEPGTGEGEGGEGNEPGTGEGEGGEGNEPGTGDDEVVVTPPAYVEPAGNASYGKHEVAEDWVAAQSGISAAIAGGNQNVDVMAGGKINVPASVLAGIAQKDVTLALQTGKGMAISVSGKAITGDAADININLMPQVNIPENALTAVTEGTVTTRIFGMEEKGAYSIAANMHFALGAENAGKYAALYYYDEATATMVLMDSFRITDAGQAMFALTRGDEYVVAVTDTLPAGAAVGNAVNADTYVVKSGDSLSKIATKHGMRLRDLSAKNPQIKNINKIYPGQVINLK